MQQSHLPAYRTEQVHQTHWRGMLRSGCQFIVFALPLLGITGCIQPEWRAAEEFEQRAACHMSIQDLERLANDLGATLRCADDPLTLGCSVVRGRTRFLLYFNDQAEFTHLLRFRHNKLLFGDRSGDGLIYSKEVCTGRRLDIPEGLN